MDANKEKLIEGLVAMYEKKYNSMMLDMSERVVMAFAEGNSYAEAYKRELDLYTLLHSSTEYKDVVKCAGELLASNFFLTYSEDFSIRTYSKNLPIISSITESILSGLYPDTLENAVSEIKNIFVDTHESEILLEKTGEEIASRLYEAFQEMLIYIVDHSAIDPDDKASMLNLMIISEPGVINTDIDSVEDGIRMLRKINELKQSVCLGIDEDGLQDRVPEPDADYSEWLNDNCMSISNLSMNEVFYLVYFADQHQLIIESGDHNPEESVFINYKSESCELVVTAPVKELRKIAEGDDGNLSCAANGFEDSDALKDALHKYDILVSAESKFPEIERNIEKLIFALDDDNDDSLTHEYSVNKYKKNLGFESNIFNRYNNKEFLKTDKLSETDEVDAIIKMLRGSNMESYDDEDLEESGGFLEQVIKEAGCDDLEELYKSHKITTSSGEEIPAVDSTDFGNILLEMGASGKVFMVLGIPVTANRDTGNLMHVCRDTYLKGFRYLRKLFKETDDPFIPDSPNYVTMCAMFDGAISKIANNANNTLTFDMLKSFVDPINIPAEGYINDKKKLSILTPRQQNRLDLIAKLQNAIYVIGTQYTNPLTGYFDYQIAEKMIVAKAIQLQKSDKTRAVGIRIQTDADFRWDRIYDLMDGPVFKIMIRSLKKSKLFVMPGDEILSLYEEAKVKFNRLDKAKVQALMDSLSKDEQQ